MGFVHPLVLWFLPLALIPVIIYYLLRFRSLRVTWGANYVLERALEQLRKTMRWDQLILIALRVLAIALLVLAFARPTASQRASSVSNTGVHHVVIFDSSYSMAVGDEGRKRIDRAKSALRELLRTWGRGEVWSLCVLEDEPRWVVEGQAVESGEALQGDVDQLDIAESAASIATALSQVVERFPAGPIDVYVFADGQASTWRGAASVPMPPNLEAQFYWLDPSEDATANAAVTRLTTGVERPLVGHPQFIEVTVRNFSDQPLEQVAVELLVDGAFRDRRTIGLLPRQSVTLAFRTQFTQEGSHYLTAQISGDALAYDNRLSAGLEVVDALRVGVVRSPTRTGKFDSAWGFFETVANAERLADTAAAPIAWQRLDQPLAPEAMEAVDVIYLDGGTDLTPALADRLRGFVDRGGGLILAADSKVNAMAWNAQLGRVGLLPARLADLNLVPVGGPQFRTLDRSQLPDPAMKLFETTDAGDLTHAKLFAWWDVESIDPNAHVLARTDNRQPWAITAGDGLGRTVLLTAGLSGTTTNVFVREFFLPLVYQLAQVAAEGRGHPRTVAPDQPIRLELPEATPDAVLFGRFGEDATPLPSGDAGFGDVAEVGRADLETGLYSMLTVTGEQSATTWFAVQGGRVDSDLTPLTPPRVEELVTAIGLERATQWPQLQQLVAAKQRGAERYVWVMAAALAVLIGEMFVQRRFVVGTR